MFLRMEETRWVTRFVFPVDHSHFDQPANAVPA